MTAVTNPIEYMHDTIAAGDHWYLAVLKTMARWTAAEETVGGRRYRYLIGGEAFDWLLLAERLIDELAGDVGVEEREALLFNSRPPLELEEEEFQALIGTPKYQAYLNFLYGVVVEEALQLAVEEEVAKEQHAHVWSAAHVDGAGIYQRIYGRPLLELRDEFQKERGLEQSDKIDYLDLKEFTYWLFKFRVRSGEGARVASDTRKGLAALSRLEAAARKRLGTDQAQAPEPRQPSPRLRRAMREKLEQEQEFVRATTASTRVIDMDAEG
ncbi:MAG TPA: hypothetical protein VJB57_17390 [Dehalococcoidia bacterium]|nr:hypothetical protein [Dehalococcoidia bacterium]